MATIANLQIDLSARTARFSEGLQRAQQRVQQFSQRVQVDLQRVTQVGQRAALVFSGMAAGLTLLTRNAGQYASQIKDAADQTGLAYRSMQELSYAASQSAADFQTLMSGLRAFVRRTAEAAAGNASFLKGFERLGFTQEQVRAGLQDIDGFLMQVADRVAELGTTAEQSAVLMTIMGDAGRRLVPFMAQGARGIRELREQARELGLVMDEQAVRRLAAFNDRMAVLQERSAAASREMAVWFLPVMEAGVGLFEDIIGAIQDIDPALRAHAVRWTVVVGAVLGAVGVLGVLGTAVSQAGALLGSFGRLVSFAFSPFVLQAALVAGAVALMISEWDRLTAWWQQTDFGQLVHQAFADMRATWEREDLTLPEKVVESVRITVRTVLGLVESIADWFLTAAIDLARDVAVRLGVDWSNSRLGQLVDQIQEWWNREDITLTEKALGVVAVSATISWVLAFARPFVEELAKQSGLAKATGEAARAGARWAVSLGRLAVFGYLAWYFLPTDIKEQVADVWNQVGTALREWNDETLGNPFVDRIGQWLQELSAHDWETGALTVGVAFAAFHALQAGTTLAGMLGTAIGRAIGVLAVPVGVATIALAGIGLAAMDAQSRNELIQRIQDIWAAEDLTITVKVTRILVEITEAAFDSLVQQLDERIFRPLRQLLGTEPSSEGWFLRDFLLAGQEERVRMVQELNQALGPTELRQQPTLFQRILGYFGFGQRPPQVEPVEIPAVLRIEQVTGFPGMASILEAIYRAEGGAAARVPYGATGFADKGHRFLLEANQRRFEELVRSLDLVEGTEDYYAAAAAVTVQHYWDAFRREFPEVGELTFAELAPEIQAMFIRYLGQFYAPPSAHQLNVNWTRNVGRILGLPGFQSGTPWTGWGPTDEVAGVVHRREAVIPWDVLRRGPAAVLEFLGAPGFQAGYVPAALGGLSGAVLAEPDPGFIARLVESVIGGLESRGIIDPETASGLRELFGNLTTIIGSLYDRAKELWDQLGQFDLGEYVAEARRFREELEALGDVAEQERLAILDRIERLDELVEIERLVAEATGQAFDETAFRAAELSRAITQVARQMFEAGESVEAIAETIAPWVEQLEPLQRQIRLQDTVNSALERFATQLSDGNRLLGDFLRNLRFEGGGLRFATDSLWSWAAGLVVDFIAALFGGGYQRQPEPRTFAAPDPYQYGLAIASGQRSELEAEIRRLEERLRQAQAAYDYLFRDALNAWWHSTFRQDLVRERQAAVERARQELENARRAYEAFDLSSFLGIDPGSIAQAVESGFDMADPSRLRESLEGAIRDALVRAWATSQEMVRLQESFRNLLDEVVDEFIRTGDLRAGALDQLRAVIAAMEERGEAFAEVLERLGFTSERLNDSFSRMVRNIPQGYRVERAIFEASPPRIPALAAGGIVTRPTLAMVGDAGPEAVVPLDRGGIGGVYVHIERMEVQDGRDFGRRLDEELRRRGLVRAGNVTAWGGRR